MLKVLHHVAQEASVLRMRVLHIQRKPCRITLRHNLTVRHGTLVCEDGILHVGQKPLLFLQGCNAFRSAKNLPVLGTKPLQMLKGAILSLVCH